MTTVNPGAAVTPDVDWSSADFSVGALQATSLRAATPVAPTDATQNSLAAAGKRNYFFNTSSGSIILNGLSGGVDGQEINIIKATTSNNLTISHNSGSGTEPIYNARGANIVFTGGYGGVKLVYDAGSGVWYSMGGA